MSFSGVLITEIFHSIQGEGSSIGLPFTFVRLTGCNLRCVYCDSSYSFHGGKKLSIEEVVEKVKDFGEKRVLLTGGEPLLQRNTVELAKRLKQSGFQVFLETHGEVSVEKIRPFVDTIIMDIKTPDSKMNRGGYLKNFAYLSDQDEIKFVLTSMSDYEFAKKIVLENNLPTKNIVFSPAVLAENMPGSFTPLSAKNLAEKILNDKLQVRFQTQLHKAIWGSHQKGV